MKAGGKRVVRFTALPLGRSILGMKRTIKLFGVLAFALWPCPRLVVVRNGALAAVQRHAGAGLNINTLSTDPARVTGGDVLVKVTRLPAHPRSREGDGRHAAT